MNASARWQLWEGLGLSLKQVKAAAKSLPDLKKEWLGSPPSGPGDKIQTWVWRHGQFGRQAFLLGWMGHPVPDPDLKDWRAIGRGIVSACVHYFFGDWRQEFLYFDEPCDFPKSRKTLPWFDDYCLGLALALCLGDDAATDRMLEWPGRDLHFDPGDWDKTRADNEYQIWLASRLRGGSAESTADLLEKVLGAKRNRPKLLAATAQALFAGDSAGFTRALTSYLRYYRTSEFDPKLIVTVMSDEGTALWHLARRRGLEVGEIAEDLMIMIPRP